jgi:hypothetical protein
MGAQVSSLVVEYCSYLWMNYSCKKIFTMSLRNGPHIWFLNWLNEAPIIPQRRDIQRGNRHLDNLNFCVTPSTRHAKSSSQCRRWNFIAKDRENAVRKVKIAFFLKMRYPWKFCSINYCRITVSDHFYWFLFIKSVNITFYFAKVCFFPYYSLGTDH